VAEKDALARAGFGRVEWHGSLTEESFDPAGSGDLMAVAERG